MSIQCSMNYRLVVRNLGFATPKGTANNFTPNENVYYIQILFYILFYFI